MNYLYILLLFIILICICNMKKYVIYEKFSKVDEQKDVDRNENCLVPKNEAFPKLSQVNQKIEHCFKDNKNIDCNLKNIEKYFAVFLTDVLLSDTSFYNVFNLNELQTNVKTFRVLVYTIFNNTKFIEDPARHNLIEGRVESVTDGLNMMKQILLFGNREHLGERIEPIDGFQYNGLKDLYDNYITIFTGKEINFEEVFKKVFDKKSNYKRDFEKHYKLNDLDGAIKKIWERKLEKEDKKLSEFPFNKEDFNTYIISLFDGQSLFSGDENNSFFSDDYKFDITRQQGYYYLRTEIEMWKELIEQNKNNDDKKKVAEEMLDYYDKGKNNRKEIFKELVKELYHGEDKNIFGKWDDKKKRYEYDISLEKNEDYSNMRRIYHNIEMYSNRHKDLFELFRPDPPVDEKEKLVLRPECESIPNWDI